MKAPRAQDSTPPWNLLQQFKKSSLVHGALGNFGVRVVGAGLGFLAQIVLARHLQASGYGVYIYVLTWINVVAVVGAIGFTTASVRFISEYKEQESWKLLRGFLSYSRALVFKISGSLAAILIIVVVCIKGLGYTTHFDTFVAAALMLPVLTQVQIRAAELRGLKWVVWSQLPEKIIRPTALVLGVLLLTYGFDISVGAPGAMIIHLVGTLLGLVLVVAIGKKAMPLQLFAGSTAEHKKQEWFSTSRDMMLIAGFNLILFQADTIMVGAIAGTTDAGLYAIASKLASIMVFVLLAVNSILGPVAAGLHAKKERARLQRVVTFGTWGIFIPSTCLGAGLFLLDTQSLSIFGEEFTQSSGALKFLIVGQLVNAMAGPANLLLNMTGHQRVSAKILGGSALINIILNATLIPLFGFVGAATATAITMVIWNTLAVWIVWQNLRIVAFTLPWHPSIVANE